MVFLSLNCTVTIYSYTKLKLCITFVDSIVIQICNYFKIGLRGDIFSLILCCKFNFLKQICCCIDSLGLKLLVLHVNIPHIWWLNCFQYDSENNRLILALHTDGYKTERRANTLLWFFGKSFREYILRVFIKRFFPLFFLFSFPFIVSVWEDGC